MDEGLDTADGECSRDGPAQARVVRRIDHEHVSGERRARKTFGHDFATQGKRRLHVLGEPRIVERGTRSA